MFYTMRRKDEEISDVKVFETILKSAKYVTLALCENNHPYLVSLSHDYDEKKNVIYFHCAIEGKKLDYLKSNNLVWGQALLDYGYTHGECDHVYATVHFSGKVTFIEEFDEKVEALMCMMKTLDRDPEALIAKRSEPTHKFGFDPESLKRVVIGRIDIDYMSGKKSLDLTM